MPRLFGNVALISGGGEHEESWEFFHNDPAKRMSGGTRAICLIVTH